MPEKDWDSTAMDNAAVEAEQELTQMLVDGVITEEAVDSFTKWWYKYFTKAGHKRLGRLLVSWAKEEEKRRPINKVTLGKDGKFHNGE